MVLRIHGRFTGDVVGKVGEKLVDEEVCPMF